MLFGLRVERYAQSMLLPLKSRGWLSLTSAMSKPLALGSGTQLVIQIYIKCVMLTKLFSLIRNAWGNPARYHSHDDVLAFFAASNANSFGVN